MSDNYSIERDLKEAKSMVDHLLPYVYGDQVYGSIGGVFGSRDLPALTIGSLLMRLQRLHTLQLTPDQKTELSAIDTQNADVYKEWSIHYVEKLVQEAKSRLEMMERFFKDCDDDPRSCGSNYGPEALRRTVVQAIVIGLKDLNQPSDEVERLTAHIDARLHRFVTPSSFQWAAELKAAYPDKVYWWLYAEPPKA